MSTHANTCCFLPDIYIRMADSSEKQIKEVKIGDYICTLGKEIQEVGCDVEQKVESYYVLETDQGHGIKITGNHPMMTDDGWKVVRDIRVGDKVAYVADDTCFFSFERVVKLEERQQNTIVYNLICEEKPLIANGFVCSDFHIQYKLELLGKLKE